MTSDYRRFLWPACLLALMIGGFCFYFSYKDQENAAALSMPSQRMKLVDIVSSAPLANRHVEVTDYVYDGRFVIDGNGESNWSHTWSPIHSKGDVPRAYLVVRTGPISGQNELTQLLQAPTLMGVVSKSAESHGLVVSRKLQDIAPDMQFPVWVLEPIRTPASAARIATEFWSGVGSTMLGTLILVYNFLSLSRITKV